jgi:hypothetical protein
VQYHPTQQWHLAVQILLLALSAGSLLPLVHVYHNMAYFTKHVHLQECNPTISQLTCSRCLRAVPSQLLVDLFHHSPELAGMQTVLKQTINQLTCSRCFRAVPLQLQLSYSAIHVSLQGCKHPITPSASSPAAGASLQ